MYNGTFLVEIGTEELPPKTLRILAESFAKNFTAELDNADIAHGNIEWFAGPRRLAIKVANLATSQPDRELQKRGPAIIHAFDAKGKPTKVAENWAHCCGITVEQALHLTTSKGSWLFHRVCIKGKSIEMLLPNIISVSLKKLPISKLMRWGANNIYFVRPVHTITLLFEDKVIPATILGIKSNRILYGHRFIGQAKLIINNANQYPQFLENHGKVIACYEKRKTKIKNDIKHAAHKINGNADLSENLLEEVTSLVEWPVVLTAQFQPKYLNIPKEILVYAMKDKQKYFPVYTNDGTLLPNFIFVANIESHNPQKIISGNERIMHQLLADIKFFLDIDYKKHLEDNLPHLQLVLFHHRLGTLRDKVDNIIKLTGWIANQIGVNTNYANRAALLSKCDLISNMVLEFPDMRGVIGMYHALRDGESEDIAIALNEQYQPRFFDDKLPSNLLSCSLAIADKINTLVGIVGIGQHPKGDKDPFALRRTALGVLRIILEKNLNLDLQVLIQKSVYLYGNKLTNLYVVDDVINFMFKRFYTWYKNKGYSADIIHAVLACRPTHPIDFDARIKAVSYFCTLKEATALTTANKRIINILAKSNEILNNAVQLSLLRETSEIKLVNSLMILRDKLQPYFIEGRYQEILVELASLNVQIDDFFKNVMVNVSNKDIRVNRLTILFKLRELFYGVADISLLHKK